MTAVTFDGHASKSAAIIFLAMDPKPDRCGNDCYNVESK